MRVWVKKYNQYIIIVSFLLALVSDYVNDGRYQVVFLLPIIIGAISLDLTLSIGFAFISWLTSFVLSSSASSSMVSITARLFFFVLYAVITNLYVKKITANKDSLIKELSLNLDLNKTLHDLLLNDSKTAIEVVNSDGRILNWNDKAKDLTGFINAFEQYHTSVFLQDEQTGQNKILDTLKTGQEYLDHEITLLFSGKEPITALVNTYALRDDRGRIRGALAIYRDITEKKRLERQIQQAEKFAALGQMAAGLAHEIRNPLTTVKGFLQLSSPASPKYDEYRNLMLDEVNRTNKLVSDFILLANPSAPVLQEVDLQQLVNSVYHLIQSRTASCNINLINRVPDLPSIRLDEEQFKHLLLSLAHNSLEAMPNGGTLGIEAVCIGSSLQIQVWDTGLGIPIDLVDKIFDPFFTTKDSGTGLGLSICYHIVKSHGGTISVYSPPDSGTTIRISIPVDEHFKNNFKAQQSVNHKECPSSSK